MSRVTIVAVAFFCALYCSACCLAFTFDDCGSTLGKFTEVSVSGCPTSGEKCALVRGTNASISIKFIPNKDISQVNVRVYGVLMDVPVPFPLEKPDACKDPNDGIDCPLHKDQEYHYTTTMFVQKKFPSVSVYIKWELVNDKAEKIVCIEFPARVK
ncbi:NPC intracellular cholesterol transporter 2 homolog a [Monomorium pharaonis]|uniref:NPC intracellular cholesterol transporter 2 homolog a n=1 Tax=Monomorium pharaonis TaxID=307658 RepID=UPI00063F2966|nr:NPC intracellular cholesterol transporter 2 homolog a [Monomorium pharaonis]